MDAGRSLRFADGDPPLPPPHLPFDLPLIPINLRDFDPDQSHPFRDRIRFDGVPYSQRSHKEHDGDVDESPRTQGTPPISSRRRSVISEVQELTKRHSINRERSQQRLKEKASPNPKIQLVPALDLKPSQASHFPMDAVLQSQKRLKKASARSKNPKAPTSPRRYDIPIADIRSYASSKLEVESQFSERTQTKRLSPPASARDSSHLAPLHLPRIVKSEKVDVDNHELHDSVRMKQNSRINSVQAKEKDRAADWSKRFEDEVNPDALLLKIDRKKDAVLSRLTRKKIADEITSPLVSGWRSEFAKKKDTLSKKLSTQLEERNEERILGRYSNKVLSKAYEGALKNARCIYHDGVPKKSLIWHRARKALMQESPDAEKISKFDRELQKHREQGRENGPESHDVRGIYSTIKIYLEDACILDHQLLNFLIKAYGVQAQTQRPVYDLLNFVRVHCRVPWKVFINSLMDMSKSEEEMSVASKAHETPTH